MPQPLRFAFLMTALLGVAQARDEQYDLFLLTGFPSVTEQLQRSDEAQLMPLAQETTELVIATADTRQLLARRYNVPQSSVTALKTNLWKVSLSAPTFQRPFMPPSVSRYAVRSGDTLAGIAARFGLNVPALLSANLELRSLDRLHPGDLLNVPTQHAGLLIRIKPGQTALSLIKAYKADVLKTAQINQMLPTSFREGDYMLLPDVIAGTRYQQLVDRRIAQQEMKAKAKRLAQYERYLAWKKERARQRLEEKYERQAKYEAYLAWKQDRKRQRLNEKYERQAQYEEYLAWKNSPKRQALIAKYERQAQYEQAQAAIKAQQAAARVNRAPAVRAASIRVNTALRWPMSNFRITSRYGERDIPFHRQVFHGGIDLAAPTGTPIYAASSGEVTQSGYGAYGLNVYTSGGNNTIIYGHMSRTAVRAGQYVQAGDLLGYVGCTGICTGPHLHFEIRLNGRTVDPLALLP